jgi:predicted TIM-barrel fold metal-dependent hydrolase
MSKPTVVDSHALLGEGVTWAEPRRDVNYRVSELLQHSERAGVDRICVCSPRVSDSIAANQFIARTCERYPRKLIGVAVHNPKMEEGRLGDALRKEVRSMGLCAVRSDGHPTRELLDAAAELQIPVIYYPDLADTRNPDWPAGPARWYRSMVASYPQVSFILPHLGQYCSKLWWAHLEALDLVKRYRNVYVDTSGLGSIKYLEMAVKELPTDRILFGSFAPELDTRVAMETIRLMKLPAERYENVIGANMLRLIRA